MAPVAPSINPTNLSCILAALLLLASLTTAQPPDYVCRSPTCNLASFIPYSTALPLTDVHQASGLGDQSSSFEAVPLDGTSVDISMCPGPSPAKPHLWGIIVNGTASGPLPAPADSLLMYSTGKDCAAPSYPGPAFAVTQFASATINWYNKFPSRHPLDFAVEPTLYSDTPYGSTNPVVRMQSLVLYDFGYAPDRRHIHYRPCDYPSPGAPVCNPLPNNEGNQVPGVVHIHGLITSTELDGLPMFTLTGKYPAEPFSSITQSQQFTNRPALLFYHDHAYGFTRLNVHAGTAGAFIVNDPQNDTLFNPTTPCPCQDLKHPRPPVACGLPEFPHSVYDIPLIFQDRAIMVDGTLGYPPNPCGTQVTDPFTEENRTSRWAPEFFGQHNLVNGRVMPRLDLWPAWWRFRLLNGANARTYNLTLPLFSRCFKIATESGYTRFPTMIPGDVIELLPAMRVEILCDFTVFKVGDVFNMTNTNGAEPIAPDVIQFNFIHMPESNPPPLPEPRISLDTQLSSIPDFQTMFAGQPPQKQAVKDILLWERQVDGCPTELIIAQCQGSTLSTIINSTTGLPQNCLNMMFETGPPLTCLEGTIEKWQFHNPTADFHPMHWHLVHVQCDYQGGLNEMRDVVAIPNDATGAITRTCYVACGSVERTVRGDISFGANTGIPCPSGKCGCSPQRLQYVFHCHILEHEENNMMSRFQIGTKDCPVPDPFIM